VEAAMSTTITLDEAQANLREVIGRLSPGDELVITENQKTVAKLVVPTTPPQCKFGTLHGTVLYVAPDFDEPLEEFREYWV
jgi:antitoxin (DNA-binding transcriptional repressor) of toxin-antitoxin stability system